MNETNHDLSHPPYRMPRLFDVLNQPIQCTLNRDISPDTEPVDEHKLQRFSSLRDRLHRTRQGLISGLTGLFSNRIIDENILDELESRLLLADVGIYITNHLMKRLNERLSHRQLKNTQALLEALREDLLVILSPCYKPWCLSESKPYTILIIGANGVGKTTTIGKLAKKLKNDGFSVLLAAGDTFRAAAAEQLQIWGEYNQVAVITQKSGADSASVIHDAIQAGRARRVDIVIADTAGRLHTQLNLMDELKKIKKVMAKVDKSAPNEILLVVDASIGQNALNQALQFNDAIGVTGLILTKMDGTAKGGILFAIAKQMELPVRFIGVGEGINDLREFDATDFVTALLDGGGI